MTAYSEPHKSVKNGVRTNAMINGRKIIALCISRIHDDTSYEYVTALNDCLTKIGCNLFVYATSSDLFWNTPNEQGESTVFDLIDYKITDGIIIFEEKIKRAQIVDDIIDKAKAHDVPIIIIGRQHSGCYNIRFDYEKGFESVVRHMVEFHHRTNLHFIAGQDGNDFSETRVSVFKKVLEENNIPYDRKTMVSFGDFWSGPTEKAVEKLIAQNRLPDTFICANDSMAISVANVMKRHNISVPSQVMISGFDGVEDIYFSSPKITSAKCRYSDLAEAASSLFGELFGGECTPKQEHLIMPHLILYESCGCCKEEIINASERLTEINNRFFRFQEESRSFTHIVSRVQSCTSLEDASRQMYHPTIYDTCCILTHSCIDSSIDPTDRKNNDSFGKDMYLFFDSDDYEGFKPHDFKRSDIIPGLSDRIEQKCALIFMALSYQNMPMGYTCFHFHYNQLANYCKMPEIVNMLNSAVSCLRSIRYQQYLFKQINDMYKLDPLTQLYNRNGFSLEYEKMLKKLGVRDHLTVVLADLDDLKKINDNYGHGEGDNAIHTIAAALKASCPPDSVCTRFGGDEMLGVICGEYDCGKLRADINAYLDKYNASSGKPYNVSTSLGIYITGDAASLDFEDLIKKSDKLMYIDKSAKKKARASQQSMKGNKPYAP